MEVSMKWLKEFVDIDVNPRDFSEDLTISGTKVEGFVDENEHIKNVVMGRVLSINKHPDADKLLVCMMDIGTGQATQIVTGADNLKEGDMVAVALHKSILPNGTKITRGKLRGVESNGMLCSLSELNLSVKDFPNAAEDGILVVEEDCSPGDNAATVLNIDDIIVEFEITPNRPDCLSMIGIAREVAATYKKPLKLHEPSIKTSGENINDYLKSVRITSPICRKYAAAVIKNIKIAPSPLWMRSRLRASGLRPINNIVDITNYVMLEYGQPMHAFDINHVEGREIIVRQAKDGETITLLDQSEHTLSADTLVIADKEKASAVAGIMGGSYSGIYADTKTIVFESANFDSVSIRLSSKKIGVRSDSSTRFEKGLDPENCLPALKRACELAVMIGAGELVEGFISEGEATPVLTEVPFDAEWINKLVGIDISKDDMLKMLLPLGFDYKDENIIVPSFRGDVTIKPDLAEEVARMYGYNKIPTTIIHGVASGGRNEYQKFTKKISDTLVALGGHEIKTFSFISPNFYDNFLLDENDPARDFVKISNPLGEETSLMRTLAVPSMMQALSKNFNNRNTDVSLFEIATTYHPNGEALPLEKDELVIGMYGEAADFFYLKGMCERLLGELYIDGLSVERYSDDKKSLHPGRSAQIKSGESKLGYFGQIHPSVSRRYGLNIPCFVASFDREALFAHRNKSQQYKSLPKFPLISRDFAFIAEIDVPAAKIAKIIEKSAGTLLESVQPFDVYHGSGITAGMKSIAFKLNFRSPDHTLKDIEVEESVAKILTALKEENIFLRF